jgi:hypothetical protein
MVLAGLLAACGVGRGSAQEPEPTVIRLFCMTDDMVGWSVQGTTVGRIEPTERTERFFVTYTGLAPRENWTGQFELPSLSSSAFGEKLHLGGAVSAGPPDLEYRGLWPNALLITHPAETDNAPLGQYGGLLNTFWLGYFDTSVSDPIPFQWTQNLPVLAFLADGRCELLE